jgi:hypothetical protein
MRRAQVQKMAYLCRLPLIVMRIPLTGGGMGVRWGAIYKRSVKIAAASRTGVSLYPLNVLPWTHFKYNFSISSTIMTIMEQRP